MIAACPGGAMSNVLCHLGKADTALSVTLTATATMITLFTIPLWVRVASAGEGGGAIEMPFVDTALLLLGAAFVLGAGVPLLLRLGARDATTIAVETCIKNSVLGLFVTTEALGSLAAAAPVAVFMTFQTPVGIGVLALYNLWRRRRPSEVG